ncbi:short-chain dehydrogenases/reductase [Aspergillus costaricaensis CBS 115574]|uniref:Short-chain dehydrogenases/reductase n=1 Tax=Aspergillus costaricaensis CBS 115574 TaxID=1448317 RepID=A0ACD1I4N2_9EURO|nr:short-chain dehydrogenases/reductase [Aspergillus costaricaensis CBS 115574]RAK84728.1 short-chain dehydrogenases/reductase [Aspergillus costaricaensis CBS 115574]
MPTLSQVRQSNTALGAQRQKMVAVFVGGTSGIGEATAKQMALAVKQPTIHLVGRNPASGSRVLEELRASNPNGSFHFIQSDVSLLRSVDKACAEITDKEKQIDLLFMSTGHLSLSKNETDEGLDDNHALRYYSRMRFVQNLMPLLSASPGPARVVSILAGGQEGTIEEDNFDLTKSWTFSKSNTYAATLNSLAIEHLATAHPTVSFLHVFPGIVRTPLMNTTFGNFGGAILSFLSRPISITPEESGERNLYLSTSAAYPPATPKDPSHLGVPLVKGVDTASASTGKIGGGSYILKYDGSNATREKLMADYRARSFPGKVWDHTLETFKRVLRSD